MELKTLKEIKKAFVSQAAHTALGVAKAEAIKWVKEFRKQVEPLRRPGKNWNAGACYALIQFFNLTQEDLK